MKLTVLGKYGPFAVNKGSTSGYLLENDNNYALLDVGSGVLSKMLNRININDLKFVVLSHLHFDHIADHFILSYAVNFLKKDNDYENNVCKHQEGLEGYSCKLHERNENVW